jgi:hypothetical protein
MESGRKRHYNEESVSVFFFLSSKLPILRFRDMQYCGEVIPEKISIRKVRDDIYKHL